MMSRWEFRIAILQAKYLLKLQNSENISFSTLKKTFLSDYNEALTRSGEIEMIFILPPLKQRF